jgi:hypothetical protein
MDSSGLRKSAHDSDFALQKYLLLQDQHDELQRHIRDLYPVHSYTYSSTAVTSPSVSPARSSTFSPSLSINSSPSPSRRQYRRSSAPTMARAGPRGSASQLPPLLDEDLIVEVQADQQRLCDVNEGLKRALTELLNCEVVRKDGPMRTWVQSRLMDTERELRTGRRRRSSGSVD